MTSNEPVSGFRLPPEFQSVAIADEHGREYQLVVEAENPGPYEQWFIKTRDYQENPRLLIKLLGSQGTLIDLGANIGTVCLPVAMSGSRVVAVEVLPRNAAKLALAASLNGLVNMRIVEAAVTSSDGPVSFSGQEAWGHITCSPSDLQATGFRLDTIMDSISAAEPDFFQEPIVMKIDVEGHELDALRGAERLLQEYRPTFIFEAIHPADEPPGIAQDCKQFVTDLGYSMYAMRGRVLAPYMLGEPQIGLVYDILTVPSERPDILRRLSPDYEIRPLSFSERIGWLEEMANGGPEHRRHAAAIVPMFEQRLRNETQELVRIRALL